MTLSKEKTIGYGNDIKTIYMNCSFDEGYYSYAGSLYGGFHMIPH